jgi:hypothetical protein
MNETKTLRLLTDCEIAGVFYPSNSVQTFDAALADNLIERGCARVEAATEAKASKAEGKTTPASSKE